MIQILAVITAKPGQREAILALFRANTAAVRAEDGCLEYVANVDAEGAPSVQTRFGADTFVAVEKWADMASFQAHVAAPHMATYGSRTRELIATRIVHVLEPA